MAASTNSSFSERGKGEFRRRQRHSFSEPLAVVSSDSGVLLGYLTDLTTSGLRLATDANLPVGALVKARIRTPGSPDGRSHIGVQMQCRWCHRDVDRRGFTAGFRFVRSTFRQKLLLQTLLDGNPPEYADVHD